MTCYLSERFDNFGKVCKVSIGKQGCRLWSKLLRFSAVNKSSRANTMNRSVWRNWDFTQSYLIFWEPGGGGGGGWGWGWSQQWEMKKAEVTKERLFTHTEQTEFLRFAKNPIISHLTGFFPWYWQLNKSKEPCLLCVTALPRFNSPIEHCQRGRKITHILWTIG